MRIKLSLFFVAMICLVGWIWYRGVSHSAAKITFAEARLGTNGMLIVDFSYTKPARTYVRKKLLQDGKVKSDDKDFWMGAGRLRPHSFVSDTLSLFFEGKTRSKLLFQISPVPSPPPSMLVTTGKMYILGSHDRMTIYDFTNGAGINYRAELSLEKVVE